MSGIGAGGMDSKQFVYLPKWVKLAALGITSIVLVLAALCVYRALNATGQSEQIIFYLSVTQAAALVLIFFLVASFSRRDANVAQLHTLTDEFLRKYMTGALQRVSIPEKGIAKFTVKDKGPKDIFGRLLQMESDGYIFEIWVGLNVNRLFVIYFLPLTEALTTERAKEIFYFTFHGAEKVGFHANYEEASLQGQRFLSIWLTAETTSDLLMSPQDKLFWSQDIAMMTESFLRTAHRHKIDLQMHSISPGPL